MITLDKFIEKSNQIHGNKYDYSKVEYKHVTDIVTIICPEHGEFKQQARQHYRGQGCPKCGIDKRSKKSRLTTKQFIQKAQSVHGNKYDYSKVNYITNNEKVIIGCPVHGYFEMTPHQHLAGCGCSKCGNHEKGSNKRMTLEEFVERAKQIHNNEYDYSLVKYKNNREKVQIICPKHGIFEVSPYVHLSGHKCPSCANETSKSHQVKNTNWFINKAKLIHGDKYDYSLVDYHNCSDKVDIVCPKHGVFKQGPSYHLFGYGCPKCGVTISKKENEIYEFCKNYFPNTEQSNRVIIAPYEIDIYIPELKIGIEYNGLMWHSDKYKDDKKYHLQKLEAANEKGIKLIQIFEDEYVNNKELVFNKIKHILNINNNTLKVPGRKCSINKITNKKAKQFLESNHIQGYSNSTIHFGAFFNDILVAVMSLKCDKNDTKNWELTRYCCDNNIISQGIASKLLSHFIKIYNPNKIKSFADRRWTINENNNLYTKLGFTFDGYVPPDYRYFKPSEGVKRLHKFGFRKQKLHKKHNLPMSMTENEMTKKLGYFKVYDCGLIRYVWTKK